MVGTEVSGPGRPTDLGPNLLGAEQRSEALDPIGRQRGERGAVVFEPCGLLAGLGQQIRKNRIRQCPGVRVDNKVADP
jgi:hypothetical protein